MLPSPAAQARIYCLLMAHLDRRRLAIVFPAQIASTMVASAAGPCPPPDRRGRTRARWNLDHRPDHLDKAAAYEALRARDRPVSVATLSARALETLIQAADGRYFRSAEDQ